MTATTKTTPSAKVKSNDGTEIAYDKTGKGPALILVAGATQFRAFDPNLAVLANLLANDFTVINYDRRGRGESGNTLPFSPRREIEDIETLIRAAAGGGRRFSDSPPEASSRSRRLRPVW